MEATPLLVNDSGEPELINEEGDYRALESFKELRKMFWIESVKVWKIAGPIIVTVLCQYGTNSATNIFVGHMGDIQLSSVSIALSVINMFAFGFMLGMGSALETLCGQAYGAGQVHLLGIYMQRSWIILTIAAIILSPIYIFATPILKILGQQDEIADLAGVFTIQILPQLFSLALCFPTQKFLQAQSKVNALAWIGIACLLLHVGLLWLFIIGLGMGTTGAAIAFDISGWVLSLAQIGYAIGWCKEGWTGLSWSAFKDLWAFVRLSIASAVMLCLEVWYMMSIIILTGHLDNAVLAVGSLSICMNFNGWEAMIFIGVNAAISVRVSNELGFGHPRAAKYAVYVIVIQSLVFGLVCMGLILAFKNDFAIIFTDSKDMRQAVAKLAYLLGFTMLLNSVQPVISGVAVGGGWQALVAYINLGCYYVFGLPFGYLLGYVANFGVQGLWGGMIAGTGMQTILLLIVLYKTNWKKEVEQTTERMRKWGGQDLNNNHV
ncbi:protein DETOXIFICATION 35 [Impatiens glandulifera]|uniref:protein DETOXIFICATION 35 n=1 Tax=Impatiens glandulifera TaxID=253017 RepID=UPI001FB11BAE|nr:protein DETOXIFICATION 35 [Impatiens glandulifera]